MLRVPTPLTVPVLEDTYTVRECPHPITDESGQEYATQSDHVDKVIWYAPGLSLAEQAHVLPQAVARCWQERFAAWKRTHQGAIPVLQSTEQTAI